MDRVMREELTILVSECYSKDGSTCKLHPVFQPQRFLNKLSSYLESKRLVIKDEELTPPTINVKEVTKKRKLNLPADASNRVIGTTLNGEPLIKPHRSG